MSVGGDADIELRQTTPAQSRCSPAAIAWMLIGCAASACGQIALQDTDGDGLRDSVETGTGIYRGEQDTGTDPNVADSDGDWVPDGIEVASNTNPNDSSSRVERPNIIYIVADDLAWGDVGCFWQNQRRGGMLLKTPNLDRMASRGAMLTNHYVAAPICAASRCAFLEGRNNGHTSIRDGAFDSPIPDGWGLPQILRRAGYRTIHIGKAGLAGRDANAPTAHPLDRGFDRFLGYLTHTQAHEHYPRNGTTASAAFVMNDRTRITDAYPDVYTTDLFTAFAKKCIVEQISQRPGQPFFLYLAHTAPHFVVQFPPTRLYPEGGGLAGGVQWTGAPSYVNTAINDPLRVDNPANVHPSVSGKWSREPAAFASMVARLDESVGDLLQTLEDLGIAENTLIVFTSDNGASPIGNNPPWWESYGPFEGIKGDLLEGGTRVPTIVEWKGTIPSSSNPLAPRIISVPSANYDWLATFAALAGVPVPSFTNSRPLVSLLRGEADPNPGRSLYFEMYTHGNTANWLDSQGRAIFPNHGGRPQYHMQALRMGKHVGLRTNIQSAQDHFQIYDIEADPSQGSNLAGGLPELQSEMKRLALGSRRRISNPWRIYNDAPIPAVSPGPSIQGLRCKGYLGAWPWLPEFRLLTHRTASLITRLSPDALPRDVDCGIQLEGYYYAPSTGAYQFQMRTSGRATMWIHEANILDNDFNPSTVRSSTVVYLAQGYHPVRVSFQHISGNATLELQHSGPGFGMRPVPPSQWAVTQPLTSLEEATAAMGTSPDTDGDGMSDRDEFIAGTDQTDPLSLTSLQIHGREGAEDVIAWQSVAGRTYELEESTDLRTWTSAGSRATLQGRSGYPRGRIEARLPAAAKSARFLRLRIQ
jgi:arylsulfatase A-like enzyme